MTRRMTTGLALLVVAGLAAGGRADDKPAKKPDAEVIQGEWKVVYCEEAGVVSKGDELKKMAALRYDYAAGGKLRVLIDGRVKAEGEYKLDPAKAPKQIDFVMPGQPGTGGIYQLDGDTLIVCAPAFARPGQPRPAKFEAGNGTVWLLMTLDRVKK